MDTTPSNLTTSPEKDSRWVHGPYGISFTVLHVGNTTAYVRWDGGPETTVLLKNFANGRFVPAPPPLPKPPMEVWFTVDDQNNRHDWYAGEESARVSARRFGYPAIVRYRDPEVKRVDGAK